MKKRLSILWSSLGLGVILITDSANGQPAPEAWVQHHPGSRSVVAVDYGGNVLVSGTGLEGGGCYTTISYSGQGVPLWTNRYHGPGGAAVVNSIALDANGKVFVTGYSYATNGYMDYATIAYSAAGVPLWTNLYNGLASAPANQDDFPSGIAVDNNGNVVVTGDSSGDISIRDFATIKYSGAGVPLWTNRYNGWPNANEFAGGIAIDGSGSVFVAGSSSYAAGRTRSVIIKYSGAGVPLWTNLYSGPRIRMTSQR